MTRADHRNRLARLEAARQPRTIAGNPIAAAIRSMCAERGFPYCDVWPTPPEHVALWAAGVAVRQSELLALAPTATHDGDA